jgi:hypothetical protein
MSEFVKDLAAAQAEMSNALLNKVNPHFRSKYADFAAVREATLPILNRHGFALIQTPTVIEGRLYLQTELAHQGGDSRIGIYPIAEGTPQQQGSALTYARRYSWSAITGIASEEDDDGNAATGNHPLDGNKGLSGNAPKGKNPSQARKEGVYPILEKEARSLSNLDDLKTWWHERQDDIRSLPPKWRELIEEEKDRAKLRIVDEIAENGSLNDRLKGSLSVEETTA